MIEREHCIACLRAHHPISVPAAPQLVNISVLLIMRIEEDQENAEYNIKLDTCVHHPFYTYFLLFVLRSEVNTL